MPMFKPISENEATGKVKEIFDEIKKARKISEVPNFWKYLANSPETLERTWNSTSQVMKPGALDAVTKELIYVAVSMTNSCEYCTKSHTAAAKKKGATEEMIKEMIDIMGIANQNNKIVEAYGIKTMTTNIPLSGILEAKVNKAFLLASKKKITSNKIDFIKTGIETFIDDLYKNKVL